MKLVGNSHRDIACSIGKSPQTPDHRNVWLTDSGNTYVERERQSLLQQDTEASHPMPRAAKAIKQTYQT